MAERVTLAGMWCRPVPLRPIRGTCCLDLAKPPLRPDLATYSQDEQIALGHAPTWDSPDIVSQVMSAKVQVRVRNLSATTAAANGLVHAYSSSQFGIGFPRKAIATQPVNLAPGGSVTLGFDLGIALVPAPPPGPQQHLPVHVRIEHPNDGRLINNSGSKLFGDISTNASGRSLSFPLLIFNQSASASSIQLSLLANELNATLSPAFRQLAPFEQFAVTVGYQVPGSLHGTLAMPVRKDLTIVGYNSSGQLVDGVTYAVRIDD